MSGRSVFAIAVGYLAFAIATMLKFLAVGAWFPDALPEPNTGVFPSGAWMGFIFGTDVLLFALAGYLTAVLARTAEVRHALGLGLLGAIGGGVVLILSFGQEPVWYQIGRVLAAVPAAVLGGSVRRRQMAAAAG